MRKARQESASRRLYRSLLDQIRDGVYREGDRLPSTRRLAEEHGLSRNTVTVAIEQLASEGHIVSRQGRASTVAERLGASPARPAPLCAAQPVRLSSYGRRVSDLELGRPFGGAGLAHDFRYGDVAASDFPRTAWRKAAAGAISGVSGRLAYGDPAGDFELRRELQAYLWRARSIACNAERILIVSGSQQALDLAARLLVEPGDRVAMEDPGYLMARAALCAQGADVLPIPCDAQGLDTDRLPASSALAYVTPSHQYPLGGVLPAGRRAALLDWAEKTGAYILEDDYDAEYRYDVKPIPPLFGASADRVLYIGTVSKTLSPTLRLGYMILPEGLVDAFRKAKQIADRHSTGPEQEALRQMIASGAYERHIRRMRRQNAARRAALISALTGRFGEEIAIAGSSAGLHLVVWFLRLSREAEDAVIAVAKEAGVGLYAISPLYVGEKPERPGFVLGYASQTTRQIEIGVAKLADALRAAGLAGRSL